MAPEGAICLDLIIYKVHRWKFSSRTEKLIIVYDETVFNPAIHQRSRYANSAPKF